MVIGNSVKHLVWVSVHKSVYTSAWGLVNDSVRFSLKMSVKKLVRDLVYDSVWGLVNN